MRIGIFGGSFNPVHVGHVVVAVMVVERLNLDRLFVVPTFSPPHRSEEDLAPFDVRYRWLETVFEGVEKIEVSDFEARKGGKSYSIETVEYFSSLFKVRPYFVIGEDWLPSLETWHRYEDLMRKCTFVVYPRFRKTSDLRRDLIFLKDLPLVEISSTDIRRRVREGRSIRGMVPSFIEDEVVRQYGR